MTNREKGLLVKQHIMGYLLLNAHAHMGCSKWFIAQRMRYTSEETVAVVIHNINKTMGRRIVCRDGRYYHPRYAPKTHEQVQDHTLSPTSVMPTRAAISAPAMVFFGDEGVGYRDGCRRVMPHGIGR
jgi:hypothetical protein